MNKFGGKESQYEYWKLQFQASYGSQSISIKEKTLSAKVYWKGSLAFFVLDLLGTTDDTTYETLWEVLDRRYGGQIREDQQVMEEFEKIKVLENYDVKKIQIIADCLVSVHNYYRKVDPGSLVEPSGLLAQKARKKLGQKAGIDYLKCLAEQGKEDTFLDLVNFINEHYQIAQRLEREFALAGKRTVAFTDSYQVEASEGDGFEQGSEADCAKFNAKGMPGSKFTCPPTQKKGRNQGFSSGSREIDARDNQKLNLTADYQKNQGRKPYSDQKKTFNTEMCPVCGAKHPLWRCSKF